LPYSVRPGYEELREQLEQKVIDRTLDEFSGRRRAILSRKIETLLRECSDYVALHLKSAELLDSERDAVKRQVIGEKQVMADVKSELRLIVRHEMGGTRAIAAAVFEPHQQEVERCLLADFASKFPAWTKSLAVLLGSFEDWLDGTLSVELARISLAEHSRIIEPLQKTKKAGFSLPPGIFATGCPRVPCEHLASPSAPPKSRSRFKSRRHLTSGWAGSSIAIGSYCRRSRRSY